MKVSRKEFLIGAGALAAGVPLGGIAHASRDMSYHSYAQSGEDLVADFIFKYLGAPNVTYLDIGAYHPVEINNTYLFYLQGHRGVLVEPNPAMCEKIRSVRPGDTTLNAGIGVTDVREADFYQMNDQSWNTFSKEEAEHMEKTMKGEIFVEKVLKMPLLDINRVMAEHFGGGPPVFLSIDAEGMHLDLLKAVDYKRFRPLVICVETLVSGTAATISEIPEFMASKGYALRGGSFANGIFVDSLVLRDLHR